MVRADVGLRLGRAHHVTPNARKAPAGNLAIFRFKLNSKILAAQERRGDENAARSGEGAQDKIACPGEGLDDRPESIDGFFGRVAAVSRIVPGQHIAYRLWRDGRSGHIRLSKKLRGTLGQSGTRIRVRASAGSPAGIVIVRTMVRQILLACLQLPLKISSNIGACTKSP